MCGLLFSRGLAPSEARCGERQALGRDQDLGEGGQSTSMLAVYTGSSWLTCQRMGFCILPGSEPLAGCWLCWRACRVGCAGSPTPTCLALTSSSAGKRAPFSGHLQCAPTDAVCSTAALWSSVGPRKAWLPVPGGPPLSDNHGCGDSAWKANLVGCLHGITNSGF